MTGRLEERKHALTNVLYRDRDGIIFNQHYDGDGAIVFKQACALGVKGIVSKQLGSPYRSGRGNDWLKIKNPAVPAVKREAEDWSSVNWLEKRESWLPTDLNSLRNFEFLQLERHGRVVLTVPVRWRATATRSVKT